LYYGNSTLTLHIVSYFAVFCILVWLPENGSGPPKHVAVDWNHVDVMYVQVVGLVKWIISHCLHGVNNVNIIANNNKILTKTPVSRNLQLNYSNPINNAILRKNEWRIFRPGTVFLVLELGNISHDICWRSVQLAPSQPHELHPLPSSKLLLALNKSNDTVTTGGWERRINVDPDNSNSRTTAVIS